jgi:hypothetical protein
MESFDVIHHLLRKVAKFAYPLFVVLRFIPNVKWALLLATFKGIHGIRRSRLKGFFLKET